MKRPLKQGLFTLACLLLIGCASFTNKMQKTLYVSATLADGTMQTYATYWKYQTNKLGDTPALEQQRSNVIRLSKKVGASLNLADRTLKDYQANVGTNTATKEVVQALINTAIQDAGGFYGEITILTDDPSWMTKTNL